MQRIKVGSRKSPLALVQVKEVEEELCRFCPDAAFDLIPVDTKGDKDRRTSLREMEKTDFFTRELDEMLLSGACDICIHSAKDLPDPMPDGLIAAAVTKGVDSSDSLIMKEGIDFYSLPPGAKIASSSFRRIENVKKLREDLQFVDIRGNIQERLDFLREADGVVIAEAALIRLKLSPNRIRLPGCTPPGQGRLAIVCRTDDRQMIKRFEGLHHEEDLVHRP